MAFGVAAGVGATGIQDSYLLALFVSVVLCPSIFGFIGGKWLRLGATTTLLGINLLPVVMALDARFHLGEPTGFGWLLTSCVFAWSGWRLGRGSPRG
jgi:hypothetical protein